MLTGQPLGQAIAKAICLKGVPKTAVAAHFGVKGPSVYDWINHGRIGKQHLTELFDYFSDVVGPEHWGIETTSSSSQPMRLTGTIILSAYQEAAVKFEHATGLNATSFKPWINEDHAELMALAINAQLSGDGAIEGQLGNGDEPERTNRSGSASAGKNRKKGTGGESKLARGERKKSAA